MKYKLYRAVDNRDSKPMLWLHDTENQRVALFHAHTAPSRIKHRTAAAPENIIWEPDTVIETHALLLDAEYIDTWSFNS